MDQVVMNYDSKNTMTQNTMQQQLHQQKQEQFVLRSCDASY
jgi:hypothetical protein